MSELARGLTRSGGLRRVDASRRLARTRRSQAGALKGTKRLAAAVVLEAVVILGVVLATLGLGADGAMGALPHPIAGNGSIPRLAPAEAIEP